MSKGGHNMKNPGISLVTLKKGHIFILTIVAVLTPVGTGYTAYWKLKKEMSEVRIDGKLSALELKVEREYVSKATLKPVEDKMDKLVEDVSWIKGFLQRRKDR